MKPRLISILLHVSVVLCLISIYCLWIENNSKFEWVIFSLTVVGIILCLIFWKELKIAVNENFLNRLIAIISLGIAMIVFLQTSIQFEKNNVQFKRNRIISDSLFQTQLKHSQKLNSSLISELSKIQNINAKNTLAAENLLLITKQQLEFSKLSFQDYTYDTRPQLTIVKTIVANIATLENNKVMLSISFDLLNVGKRVASEVEFREIIIYKDGTNEGVQLINYLEIIHPDSPRSITFSTTMPQEESENFYRWIHIQYFDNGLAKYINESYYYHYFKTTSGFGFPFAKKEEKLKLSRIVNEELVKKGISLPIN